MDKIEIEVRQKVEDAISEQIANPARAVVNSESSFVWQRLVDQGHKKAASRYWSWACSFTGRDEDRSEFGDKVFELQKRLEEIDRGVGMPEWGTYGT